VSAASGSQATSAGGTKRKHGARVGCVQTGRSARRSSSCSRCCRICSSLLLFYTLHQHSL
jgi:hypothetical protein